MNTETVNVKRVYRTITQLLTFSLVGYRVTVVTDADIIFSSAFRIFPAIYRNIYSK